MSKISVFEFLYLYQKSLPEGTEIVSYKINKDEVKLGLLKTEVIDLNKLGLDRIRKN